MAYRNLIANCLVPTALIVALCSADEITVGTRRERQLIIADNGYRLKQWEDSVRYVGPKSAALWEIEKTKNGWLIFKLLRNPDPAGPLLKRKYLCGFEPTAERKEFFVFTEQLSERCYWQIEQKKTAYRNEIVGFLWQPVEKNRRVYVGYSDTMGATRRPILTDELKPQYEIRFEEDGL